MAGCTRRRIIGAMRQAAPAGTERAKALAAYGASIGVSFAIGPFVGGALTEGLGWRAIFLVNVPIGIAALWIALRRVAESRDPEARGIDWPGQATLIGVLFLVVLALLRGNDDGWASLGMSLRSPPARRCSPRSWRSSGARARRCSRCDCSATACSPAPRSPC
jgi:MFS family permease